LRHRLTAALLFALTAAVGSFAGAQPVQADGTPSATKVVIIVGPVGTQTSDYRTDADAAYSEAIKYTPHVTKVYSPNATWSNVKQATTGANIVIYFGHGNGWPSPYFYDPEFKTKDGFGLNRTTSGGDRDSSSYLRYYGEPDVATLNLAPGAIILLHRLCYASGNSEPGDPAPSKSVAKQRVDNYGAGFLKAGVSAVIADGHHGPASYLRSLFTTDQTLPAMWRAQPNYNGNEFSFPSARSPRQTAFMDPESSTRYYRSMVGNPEATTVNVREGTAPPIPGLEYEVQGVFNDLWTSSFVGSIQWIYDEGITVGCSPTLFCPKGSVTRGQMAAFIVRAMDLPAATKDYFDDDDGKTFESSINAVAEAGITGGCEPNRFCREASVSRAQMAAFLVRALNVPPATKDFFSDDDHETLESSINAMAEAGLTGGCGGDRFCPDAPVTREQMAAFLLRAFKP
jgi:hypothetical protein